MRWQLEAGLLVTELANPLLLVADGRDQYQDGLAGRQCGEPVLDAHHPDQRLAASRRRLDDLALVAVSAEDRERLVLVWPRIRGADQVSRAPRSASGGAGFALDHHQHGRQQERRGCLAEAGQLREEIAELSAASGQVPQAAKTVLLQLLVDARPDQCLERGVILIDLEVGPFAAVIGVSLPLDVPGVD